MKYKYLNSKVLNRGTCPNSFLNNFIEIAKSSPNDWYQVNQEINDVYNLIRPKFGPWKNIIHRKAALLECMRVLGGFESSWDWNEGVDTTNPTSNTDETIEAGLWQISYNSRYFGPDLKKLLLNFNITNGNNFQIVTKTNHSFAFEYAVKLFRHTIGHNGPLKRKEVLPWMKQECIDELIEIISS